MQVKKNIMKESIIKFGQIEFLEKGYEKASLRKIVKNAGTTTGNFYNYFPNKEALFSAIVTDVCQMFYFVIKNHDKWQDQSDILALSHKAIRHQLKILLLPHMAKLDLPFVLLMECAKGTSFENTRRDFKELLADHFMEHIGDSSYPHKDMGKILAEQFISGLLQIIKIQEDHELRCEFIIEQVLFYAVGVMGILQID